ncbi:hypothetical protein GCM10010328_54190 [Streptomyces rubiginosohelvolus]|uniref:Uncharacterized protein n=1 Tax=Streptomyces rubiginosohelvolus TaxID=67362 RepID=A0ABQ3C888_9ACTN|nr:hypothetical protein GCM10010328_54190 [Streptomyces pluricolorescens]
MTALFTSDKVLCFMVSTVRDDRPPRRREAPERLVARPPRPAADRWPTGATHPTPPDVYADYIPELM